MKQQQLFDKDSLKLCQEGWSIESDEISDVIKSSFINIVEREKFQDLFNLVINDSEFGIRPGECFSIQGDDWDTVRLRWGEYWENEAFFDRDKYIKVLGDLINLKDRTPDSIKCSYDIDDNESYKQQQSEKIEYFIAENTEYSQNDFRIIGEKHSFGINYIDDDLPEKCLSPSCFRLNMPKVSKLSSCLIQPKVRHSSISCSLAVLWGYSGTAE